MLADLTVKDFLDKVACSDPVPGGGSIAALNGALASALSTMVARLTVGKKGYEASEEVMQHAQTITLRLLDELLHLLIKIPLPTTKSLPASNFLKQPTKRKLSEVPPFRKQPNKLPSSR